MFVVMIQNGMRTFALVIGKIIAALRPGLGATRNRLGVNEIVSVYSHGRSSPRTLQVPQWRAPHEQEERAIFAFVFDLCK